MGQLLELGKFRFGDLEVYEFEEEDDIEEANHHSWLKYNVGNSIFLTKGSFGIDVCFRDDFGQFVHAYSRWFQFEASTVEIEATALHVALQITIDSELDWINFESNCGCTYKND